MCYAQNSSLFFELEKFKVLRSVNGVEKGFGYTIRLAAKLPGSSSQAVDLFIEKKVMIFGPME